LITLVTDGTVAAPEQVILRDEQGWTSHQIHYRSYRERLLRVKWPNQQCQSTEGR